MVNVCIDENLSADNGVLSLSPGAVPRIVVDQLALSGGDGVVIPQVSLPGKLMIDQLVTWTNTNPLDQMVLVRVQRSRRDWVVSNPNAIQIRDRWTTAIDDVPDEPITTTTYNSQVGSAIDLSTNTIAEPNTGKMWGSFDAHISEEWVGPVGPGEALSLWYRCYLWTPPPWSDNANSGSPEHSARVRSTRLQLISFPQQGTVVAG